MMNDLQARYVLHLAKWLWTRKGDYTGEHADRPLIDCPTWEVYGDPRYGQRKNVTISSRTQEALIKRGLLKRIADYRITLTQAGWEAVPALWARLWWSDWANAWGNIAARHAAVAKKRRLKREHADWWPKAWAAAWGRITGYYAADQAAPMTPRPGQWWDYEG